MVQYLHFRILELPLINKARTKLLSGWSQTIHLPSGVGIAPPRHKLETWKYGKKGGSDRWFQILNILGIVQLIDWQIQLPKLKQNDYNML